MRRLTKRETCTNPVVADAGSESVGFMFPANVLAFRIRSCISGLDGIAPDNTQFDICLPLLALKGSTKVRKKPQTPTSLLRTLRGFLLVAACSPLVLTAFNAHGQSLTLKYSD